MLSPSETEFPIVCQEALDALVKELPEIISDKSILLWETDVPQPVAQTLPLAIPHSQFLGLWVSEYASVLLYRCHKAADTSIKAELNSTLLAQHLQKWIAENREGPLHQKLRQAKELHRLIGHQDNRVVQNLLQRLIKQATLDCAQTSPTVAACQPIVDAAMTRQLAQDGLIHRVTTQIRQSLELPEILSTAADQVRQILDADRFVIYQFQEKEKESAIQPLAEMEEDDGLAPVHLKQAAIQPSHATRYHVADLECMGTVTYESCRDSSITSVLNYSEKYCWNPSGEAIQRYQKGKALAISDVEAAYGQDECMLAFLADMQVQAKLVVPILVQSELWGLLIAHQCRSLREWTASETSFLEQISEHLSVAIAQSQLYHQLHQQKSTLELQVQQRTQELQDALIRVHAANQAKSEFLATMSHELRTPLTCVIGMSATLLRWSLGPLTEKQRSYLQTIHDSGEHLLDLINDILDLSNVEAGRASLNVIEFSVSSLAHQSLQMLRDKAHERDISLKAQIDLPTGRDRFMADSRRIKQILFNLLSNSIKFTPAGGQVILRVWRESNSCIFQVEDTGIGIPENQKSRLFQKFQQLDTSYRRSYEGTGLGLALVKQFVDMHNGWIEVDSEEGKGATFTVEIPNQTELTADGQIKNIDLLPRMPLAGSRILLVEPQDEQASLICDILTAAGYQVIWMVESGITSPQVKILQPILVIIEADHSDSHSLNMVRKIHKAINPRHTKILVLTSENISDQKSELLEWGADAFLAKPIKADHLLHRVENMLLTLKQ